MSEFTERLVRIETKLDTALAESARHDKRISAMEHTVNGNGQVGLAEEVRNLKAKVSWIVGGVTLIVNAGFQLLLKWGGK